MCSYIRPDYPLFTLYFALYTMRVPSLTEEIRATGDFKLHLCIQSADMPSILSSDKYNIIYE